MFGWSFWDCSAENEVGKSIETIELLKVLLNILLIRDFLGVE
jgi:hypothetical protein